MEKVIVVDTPMGSGKTIWSHKFIDANRDKNFLFITQYLGEIRRLKRALSRNVMVPNDLRSSKFDDIKGLLKVNPNYKKVIGSTHALFKMFDEEMINLIKEGEYVLILDEAMTVIEPAEGSGAIENIETDDIELLVKGKYVEVREDKSIVWKREEYKGVFSELKDLISQKPMYCYRDKYLIWEFPPEIFKAFKEVYVMTYMFESSIMAGYFSKVGINYVKKSIPLNLDEDIELVPFRETDTSKYAPLIKFYSSRTIGNIESDEYALSYNWYQNRSKKKNEEEKKNPFDILKSSLATFFTNEVKKSKGSKKKEKFMWTTYKSFADKLCGGGYKYYNEEESDKENDTFVSCNCRATNQWIHKKYLAYCVNRYLPPSIRAYFQDNDIPFDEDKYALSEFLQWTWRSRIRDGKEIVLYIPSIRMRRMFYEWLGIEFQEPPKLMKRRK